jgi:predicted nucleic acid-binding protein
MEAVILDTDVFSFLFKRDTRAGLYEPDLRGRQLCLSFQTVAELKEWSIERNWGTGRRQSLEAVLMRYVVLPYHAAMADRWAEIVARRKRMGHEIGCGDAWIAASALQHGALLLTHNGRDYADIPGLRIITHGPAT